MSPAPKVRAIIFDIGRVIIRIDLRRAQVALAQGLPLSPEELWSAIERDPRWADWQEGRMSARDWHQNLSNRLGITLTFEEFCMVWNSILDPTPILPDELFRMLSKRNRLALLSNTDKIHVAHMEATYDFFHYFPQDCRIYSCTVGTSKPAPLIYREALRACKAKAEEAVFIDDIAANVDAARRLGMFGVQFQSPEQLIEELEALGVVVQPVTHTK
jgi:glucose-1-phosphatase